MMKPITPGGHIDQLLRQTRAHHVQLSVMADVKANILLTLSSLLITFSIRYLSDPYLKWPVIVLIAFCMATVTSAAYSVMPKLDFQWRPSGRPPRVNMLFFGNFMNMSYDEYLEVMEDTLDDPAQVYEMQIREVYELGVFLAQKKYRFIRLAYQLLIAGMFASGLIWLVVELALWLR